MTSVARRREQDDSGEYSDASQDIEQNNSGNDASQQASDYDSRGSDSEHSDREEESQESQTERRVDDDEDRSNPQYIPKRGTFYEHDDRTAASGEELSNTTSETASEKKEGSETPSERRRPPRKSDTINKWSHDKYNENEQMPKSRDELVAIYGYDIRNEDAPPHARRNRRYGRGPNKYTRTWEDEEAYKRQTAAAAQHAHRKPPTAEDFPELDAKINMRRARARPRSKSQPASNDSSESGAQLRRHASIKGKGRARPPARHRPPQDKLPPTDNMPPIENLTITASVFNNSNGPARKVSAAVAQQRPVPTEQGRRKPQPHQPQTQQPQSQQPQPQQQQQPPSAANNNSKQQQQPPPQQQKQNNQQQQQNAAANEPRGGSKRYSSLRQRPLAEPYSPQTPQQKPQQQQQPQPQQQQPQPQPQPQPQQPPPQQQQQQHRYHGEFVSGAPPAPHQGSPVPQIHPQQMMHQVHRNAGAALAQPVPLPPAHIDHSQQQVRLGILEQQQIVPHPHHGMHQTHSIGQMQPPQAYAPPAIMPTQYMQQQSGNAPVFGGAMFQPPAAYPHQIYPHHNYQATQAGGVTYYSCAEQEQQPRAQRRPTAAIPIVRPAPSAPHAAPPAPLAAPHDRPANSTEKDNIDRIVENMFVRKPWPAAHGVDSKDKPDNQRSSQEPTSKESSQPNSLTSSSISTDSKPEPRDDEVRGQETRPQETRGLETPGQETRESGDSAPAPEPPASA